MSAGDRALHDAIERNKSVVDAAAERGDGLAVAFQKTRAKDDDDGEDEDQLNWATEWIAERADQKSNNARLIATCRKMKPKPFDFTSKIQTYANQASVGFDCSTKAFKVDNAIPVQTPLAEYMSKNQLAIRDMYQGKVLSEKHRNPDISAREITTKAIEHRDKFKEFLEYVGETGIKKRPLSVSHGQEARAIETSRKHGTDLKLYKFKSPRSIEPPRRSERQMFLAMKSEALEACV